MIFCVDIALLYFVESIRGDIIYIYSIYYFGVNSLNVVPSWSSTIHNQWLQCFPYFNVAIALNCSNWYCTLASGVVKPGQRATVQFQWEGRPTHSKTCAVNHRTQTSRDEDFHIGCRQNLRHNSLQVGRCAVDLSNAMGQWDLEKLEKLHAKAATGEMNEMLPVSSCWLNQAHDLKMSGLEKVRARIQRISSPDLGGSYHWMFSKLVGFQAFGVSWCIWFAYLYDIHIRPYDLWYLWAFCMCLFVHVSQLLFRPFESSSNLSGSETWCNQGKKAQISRSSQAGHGKVQRFLLQKTLSPTASPTAGFREGRLKPKCGDDEELSKKLCDDWKLMAFMGRTRILNDDQSAQLRI